MNLGATADVALYLIVIGVLGLARNLRR
ncbi:MAG: DUF3096 domain-containing protein [Gammaproteobacteria bacterium]|nr:DUF3096 domain-containing protein [Gammaproteobacteria bacterium]